MTKKFIVAGVIIIFAVFVSMLAVYRVHSIGVNNKKVVEKKVLSVKNIISERNKKEEVINMRSVGIKAQILAEKVKEKKEIEDKEKALVQQKADELAKSQQEAQQKIIEAASAIQNAKASTATSNVNSQTVVAPSNSVLVVAGQTINTGSSSQIMVVYASGYGVVLSTAETYEKVNNLWQKVSQFVVNVGVHGFASPGAKREGDGKSPSGNYDFGSMMFGQAANPGVNYNYKQVGDQDYWVDDSSSSYYNQYKSGTGGFNSAEHLNIHSYLYAAVIGYNQGKIPGLGSAIFFHLWSGAGSGTAGCISTDQSDLVNTLKWLKPSANPHIIMGVKGNLQ